jgi:hypothetical protein
MNRLPRPRIAFFLGLVLLGRCLTVSAFETNQYDLSPLPLADIGDEVSDHVEQKLREAIDRLNSQIEKAETCLKRVTDSKSEPCDAAAAQAKLEYLRSNEAVTQAAYEALGTGIPPFSTMETWTKKHRFQNKPARYKVGFWKSLFLLWPANSSTSSPTVNLYGSEFGTDKITHYFQQGYTYYKTYNRALAEGATGQEARRKAVRWGQKTEDTFYGTWITGVYSNGDLFANYVGMKFYQGLTRELETANESRPAILILKQGLWAFNEHLNLREALLKPLISDQLNEALNPSIFSARLGLRWFVRRKVSNRSCARWFNRYPGLTRAGLEEKSRALTSWYGEDYGFTGSEHFITIANTCFDEEGKPKLRPE